MSDSVNEKVRCLIIGSGPAGYTAAIYASRANLSPVLYEGIQPGGQLTTTTEVENFPGYPDGITGPELMEDLKKQAVRFGADIRFGIATAADLGEAPYKITIDGEKVIETETLIIATGASAKYLGLPDEHKYAGMGVSACATCDGFFYKNKDIAVLGNGRYAISETNALIHIANHITILTDGEKPPEIRAENVDIDTRKIREIKGDKKIEEIEFEDSTKMKTDGLFVALGVAGSNEFAKKLGILTQKDRIVVNENMETNIPGIYACGDCTGGLLQVSKAVYEGAKTGLQAIRYLRK